MSQPLLVADGLVKRYGGVVATDNVSLHVNAGEVLGIIGPNGAGKSTLFGLIGGSFGFDAGHIEFDGEDITRLAATMRARKGIARTYQIPRPFLGMTVRENLMAAQYALHPFQSSARVIENCDEILERCGLADSAEKLGRDLPLLRRKRLEVARALSLKPKLLLLDEVGAGLVDSEVGELIDLINKLRTEVVGIIIIEHVLRVVRECCERLVVINFGKKFAEGSTRDVLASDQVAAVYLGTANTRKNVDSDVLIVDSGTHEALKGDRSSLSATAISGLVGDKSQGSTPVLELQGVHAGYGQARVLNGVDLKVEQGRVVAILGTNGAGKTTLSNIISGSIQPTVGRILVDGKDVTGAPPHQIFKMGLAQCLEGRRIFPSLSVEENLLLPASDIDDEERMSRIERVYTLFPDLKERRRNAGTSMSGGQQQMLAIGRALMSRPRLVLFDEISLGLAPIMMDRLYAALADLRAWGLTMVIVEQDVERALDLADEVHVMEHGRFALSGSAKSVRDSPMLRHLYIGSAD